MKKPKADVSDATAIALGATMSLLHGVAFQCVDKTAVSMSAIFVGGVPMMRFEARWTEDNHSHGFISDSINCSNPEEIAKLWKVLTEFTQGLVQKRGKPLILPNGQ